MASRVLPQVDDARFDQMVLSEPSPIMVEFFTPWCPHCGRLAPVLEDLARDYAGRLPILQYNADHNRGVVGRLGVRGVPTMIVFAGGQEQERIVGALPKEMLKERIDRVLERAAEKA